MNKHLNAIRKTGFGSLFTPTKAMSRMRAIATDRTQSSLTGGCFEPGIIRISTEFCGAEGEPGPLGATGPGNVRFRRPSRTCRGGRRSIAVGGRKCSDPHPFLRNPSTLQMRKRQNRIARLSLRSTWRARNSQRSINASHCSFESLAHNSQLGDAALLIRTSVEIEQPHRVTPG